MFTNMDTADKEDSNRQDELEMKVKNAYLAEWSVDDLKSVLAKLKVKGADRWLLPFTKNENQLLEKRLNEVRRSYIFETSMDSSQIPPPSSVWNADQTLYLKLDSTTISD